MSKKLHEPAWLTDKVNQLIERMKAEGASAEVFEAAGVPFVMTFLTEPGEGAGPIEFERWEMTCDNCGKVSNELRPGAIRRIAFGVRLEITFGICAECAKTLEEEE
jgi:hypothetical protein